MLSLAVSLFLLPSLSPLPPLTFELHYVVFAVILWEVLGCGVTGQRHGHPQTVE